LLASILLASILLASILLASILLASILLASILLASILLASILLASILLDSILLASILLASILLVSILLASILLVQHLARQHRSGQLQLRASRKSPGVSWLIPRVPLTWRSPSVSILRIRSFTRSVSHLARSRSRTASRLSSPVPQLPTAAGGCQHMYGGGASRAVSISTVSASPCIRLAPACTLVAPAVP
jgi:hypothetical protein